MCLRRSLERGEELVDARERPAVAAGAGDRGGDQIFLHVRAQERSAGPRARAQCPACATAIGWQPKERATFETSLRRARAGTSPMMVLIVVVLPMPLRPSRVTTSPASTAKADVEQHLRRTIARRERSTASIGFTRSRRRDRPRRPADPRAPAQAGRSRGCGRRSAPKCGRRARTRPPCRARPARSASVL